MNTSLSKELSKAKQYFKIKKESHRVKDVIYDIGSGYAFPPKPVFKELPPGTYHIDYNRESGFMLSKVAKSSNNLPTDEDMLDLFYALGEDTDEVRRERTEETQAYIHEQNYGFMEKGYFPLHKFNSGLKKVHDGIIKFLNNKEFYDRAELGYKRSILLYGKHGTGKSRYLDWISKNLIKELDAIVIRVNSGDDVERLNDSGILTLNRVIKDRLIVFLIEELSSIVSYRNAHISLLHFLDNPILRDNVLVLTTTNNPEKIPLNIIDRHQRLDMLVEISAERNDPDFPEAFYEFVFQEPMPAKYKASQWYSKELSPATMKELFLYSQMNQVDLDEAYHLIKQREELIRNDFEVREPMGFGLFN